MWWCSLHDPFVSKVDQLTSDRVGLGVNFQLIRVDMTVNERSIFSHARASQGQSWTALLDCSGLAVPKKKKKDAWGGIVEGQFANLIS